MGTDYRLLDPTGRRYLDIQGYGSTLLGLHIPQGVLLTIEHLQNVLENRRSWPEKGIWTFVRDSTDGAILASEHEDCYDDPNEGWTRFSLYSKTGHWKRLGYGPAA